MHFIMRLVWWLSLVIYLWKLSLTEAYFPPAALGSIPELPAESCTEIKASEGEEASSGKYWFDSISPQASVLAYCNMDTEGESSDTCTDSKLTSSVSSTKWDREKEGQKK